MTPPSIILKSTRNFEYGGTKQSIYISNRVFGGHFSVVFIDLVQTYRNKITKRYEEEAPQTLWYVT